LISNLAFQNLATQSHRKLGSIADSQKPM